MNVFYIKEVENILPELDFKPLDAAPATAIADLDILIKLMLA